MRRMAVGAVVMAGLGLMAVGCGRGDPAHRAERAQKHVRYKLERLVNSADPTDAQRQQLAPIQERLQAEVPGLVTGLEQARVEVRAQLESPTPDGARMRAIVDERTEALRALGHKVVDALVEAHGVLTPEQRERVLRR